jgi:CRP-like cAMP-binding protein
MMKSMLRQYFTQLSIFEGLDQKQIELLSPYFEETRLPKGAAIFEQGEVAECLYILLEGEVEVRYKPYDGPPLSVAHIIPGGVFGWSAALGRREYTSGAQAGSDCLVVRVRNESLQRLCESYPDTGGVLLDRLAGVIAERLRNTHASILAMLSQGIDTNGNCSKRDGDQ